MKIAYFDCFSGAAGDMIVGAMLDAGLDFEFLKSQIATLGLKDLGLKINETKRAGLRAIHFIPLIKEEHHHRHLSDITKIINNSKIGEKPKQTAIAIFERLAKAEAASSPRLQRRIGNSSNPILKRTNGCSVLTLTGY